MRSSLGLMFAALAGCAGTGGVSDDTDTDNDVATFTRVRNEVLGTSCAFSTCHGSGSAGLTLTGDASDHAELVNAPSSVDGKLLVAPGDPDASYLVAKLDPDGDFEGDLMPQGGNPIPAEKLELVRAWILAGALND